MPRALGIINYSGQHPRRDLTSKSYVINWLAWNPVIDKVLVLVEFDTDAERLAFRADYPSAVRVDTEDFDLPGQRRDWKILIGDTDDDDPTLPPPDEALPMKARRPYRRVDRLRARLAALATQRAQEQPQGAQDANLAVFGTVPAQPTTIIAQTPEAATGVPAPNIEAPVP